MKLRKIQMDKRNASIAQSKQITVSSLPPTMALLKNAPCIKGKFDNQIAISQNTVIMRVNLQDFCISFLYFLIKDWKFC